MTSLDQAPAKRRRWLRFSLRTLLVVVTLLCVWLAMQVNAARRQREAVAVITKAGGSVSYDFETTPIRGFPDRLTTKPNPAFPAPEWLRTYFGDDSFRSVIEVDACNCRLQTSDFTKLCELSGVWYLFLTNTEIAPSRDSASRPIGDSELQAIGKLVELRRLLLCKADVHAKGLAFLVNLKHLRVLDLNSSHVDDAALEPIGRMTTLQHLRLADTQITDAGLVRLRDLCGLLFLDLVGTAITDAALQHLERLQNLMELDVRKTLVSPEGIRELQKSLPNTKISGP